MAGRDPLKNSYPKDLVSYLDLMDISVILESICWPILQSVVEFYSTEKALYYCIYLKWETDVDLHGFSMLHAPFDKTENSIHSKINPTL